MSCKVLRTYLYCCFRMAWLRATHYSLTISSRSLMTSYVGYRWEYINNNMPDAGSEPFPTDLLASSIRYVWPTTGNPLRVPPRAFVQISHLTSGRIQGINFTFTKLAKPCHKNSNTCKFLIKRRLFIAHTSG